MKEFFTDNYGKRIIVRRRFISSNDINLSSLYILKTMIELKASNNSIMVDAGAKVSYKLYKYEKGYILQEQLEQVQLSKLIYVFKEPYKSAQKFLDNQFAVKTLNDNSLFLRAKELSINVFKNKMDKSNSDVLMYLDCNYTPILLSLDELEKCDINDVLKTANIISSATIGDCYLIGLNNNKPIIIKTEYEKSISDLDNSCNGTYYLSKGNDMVKKIYSNPGFIFMVNTKKIDSFNSLLKSRQISYLLINVIKRILKESYNYKIDITSDIVSNDRMYFYIKSDKEIDETFINNIYSIFDSLPSKIKDIDYVVAEIEMNNLIIERSLDYNLLLDDIVLLSDFKIEIEDNLIFVSSFSKDDLKDEIKFISLSNKGASL